MSNDRPVDVWFPIQFITNGKPQSKDPLTVCAVLSSGEDDNLLELSVSLSGVVRQLIADVNEGNIDPDCLPILRDGFRTLADELEAVATRYAIVTDRAAARTARKI